mmetsp:Transcript_42846/g.84858  ORF Transcript_42846/g.84858 Transcript_42846/m.84858 type:complete len:113 (-) Transcript_42846:161-499(-)
MTQRVLGGVAHAKGTRPRRLRLLALVQWGRRCVSLVSWLCCSVAASAAHTGMPTNISAEQMTADLAPKVKDQFVDNVKTVTRPRTYRLHKLWSSITTQDYQKELMNFESAFQ